MIKVLKILLFVGIGAAFGGIMGFLAHCSGSG
jgi:hypothetical protein